MQQTALILIFITSFCFEIYGQESRIDSTILNVNSTTVGDMKYTVMFKTDDFLYVTDSTGNIIYRQEDSYPNFEFKDIDNDGNEDIVISHMTNIPGVEDLLLFDKTQQTFVPVENFSKYPDSKSIKGTKYFYSYHRSGCADMNWDSDLFYIVDFKTIKIGNISGRECDNIDEKDGIYIYKIRADNKVLIETLPIDSINKYPDYKWGFIADYWTKKYDEFK
jgi:hypothetical protein